MESSCFQASSTVLHSAFASIRSQTCSFSTTLWRAIQTPKTNMLVAGYRGTDEQEWHWSHPLGPWHIGQSLPSPCANPLTMHWCSFLLARVFWSSRLFCCGSSNVVFNKSGKTSWLLFGIAWVFWIGIDGAKMLLSLTEIDAIFTDCSMTFSICCCL